MRAISDQHHTHHSPEAWDDRYGDAAMWSGHPNEALVREVAGLAPGTALDVGCGEGADAVWLARRGWTVEGLDVSGKALARARAAAEEAGVEVRWLHQGLEDLAEDAAYDLVSVFYPALLRADGAVIDVLLDAVAEGGTLLVVHHAHVDRERAREHGFDPDDYVRHEDVLASLSPTDWTIEVAGEQGRTAPEGPGAHHHTDLVLRAWRKVSA
ncbi:class I SAM-dependent methyltransferase [Nocardioides sp.]|uniref:class I SAM-dependent methyltransferase n=1 Tax=Nocardioides sp. TaxID=35761 RepID=UPI0035B4D242